MSMDHVRLQLYTKNRHCSCTVDMDSLIFFVSLGIFLLSIDHSMEIMDNDLCVFVQNAAQCIPVTAL